MNSDNNSSSNIMQSVEGRFERFKLYILSITKKNNDYIDRFREMKASAFLGAAQLLIDTHKISTVEQFGEQILSTTGLAEDFAGVGEEKQPIIRNYCSYFYDVLAILNKK